MSDPNKVECRRPDGCDDAWRCSAGLPECGYEACDCRSYCHKAASAPTPTDYLRDAFDALDERWRQVAGGDQVRPRWSLSSRPGTSRVDGLVRGARRPEETAVTFAIGFILGFVAGVVVLVAVGTKLPPR